MTTLTTKTGKLILRPFKMSDANSVVRHANDKTIYRNLLTLPYPYTLKDARKWLKTVVPQYRRKNPEQIVFAVELKGEVIGSIGLHKIIRGHKAEMGYWLSREYRGRGIMTETIRSVTDYGFKKLGLRRIYASVFLFNKASMRVLEKNGFEFEGVLKKDAKKENYLIDCHLFAKTR